MVGPEMSGDAMQALLATLSGADRQFYLLMRSYEMAASTDAALAQLLRDEILANRNMEDGLSAPPSSPIYVHVERNDIGAGDPFAATLGKWVPSSSDDDIENPVDRPDEQFPGV